MKREPNLQNIPIKSELGRKYRIAHAPCEDCGWSWSYWRPVHRCPYEAADRAMDDRKDKS